MGLEPTTHGTTIRYSNQLSYIHRLFCECKYTTFFFQKLSPTRFFFIFVF